jgi:hypothetical protein
VSFTLRRLYAQEKSLGVHLLAGPYTCVKTPEKRKTLALAGKKTMIPLLSSLYPSNYTDCAKSLYFYTARLEIGCLFASYDISVFRVL